MDRFSEYRVMWVLVFFDLPTDTKKERKASADFRKKLLSDGFVMFQFSIYMLRQCGKCQGSREKGEVDSSSAGSGRDSDNHGQTIFVNGTFYRKEVNRAADRVYSA